jgi:DNA-binding response OmpR family regulator
MPQPLGSLRQRTVSSADRPRRGGGRPSDPMLRVLFVAHDQGIADLYRLKLELDGYQVDVVPITGPALERARRAAPDLMFIDIRLPEPEGMALVSAIRGDSELRHIPLVILTNGSAAILERAGLELGSLDYVIRVVDLAAAS